MTTINQHIDDTSKSIRSLSSGRKATLRRQAVKYAAANPSMADANGFWRGLSARHVIAALTKTR